MDLLKGSAYIVAAIALLGGLVTAGLVFFAVLVFGGAIMTVIMVVLSTARALREHFGSAHEKPGQR